MIYRFYYVLFYSLNIYFFKFLYRHLLGLNQITVNRVADHFYGISLEYLNANNLVQGNIIVDHVAVLFVINVAKNNRPYHLWDLSFQ